MCSCLLVIFDYLKSDKMFLTGILQTQSYSPTEKKFPLENSGNLTFALQS